MTPICESICAAISGKNASEMLKQSHRNHGSIFISSDGEGRVSQVQDAYTRSGKPAENGTGIVAERQVEPEAAKKKEIHDENLYETLEKPKKVCISIFLIYYTAICHVQI